MKEDIREENTSRQIVMVNSNGMVQVPAEEEAEVNIKILITRHQRRNQVELPMAKFRATDLFKADFRATPTINAFRVKTRGSTNPEVIGKNKVKNLNQSRLRILVRTKKCLRHQLVLWRH